MEILDEELFLKANSCLDAFFSAKKGYMNGV